MAAPPSSVEVVFTRGTREGVGRERVEVLPTCHELWIGFVPRALARAFDRAVRLLPPCDA